jgi:ubiquitin
MNDSVNLTIKIPLDLKEKIRAAALENENSLSAEVAARLTQTFASPSAKHHPKRHKHAIDNQGTEEQEEQALSQKELKSLRLLLKSVAKSKSKKK